MATGKWDGEAQMVSWRYASLSSRGALHGLARVLRSEIPEGGVLADPDARYAWEKRMMHEKKLLPLVAVPDFAVLDPRVRNWSPAPWGEWRLADVWLDEAVPPSVSRDAAKKSLAGARP